VRDTRAAPAAGAFPRDAPYRCILSVPVDCEGRIVGVLNIDATRPDMLEIGHGDLVMDLAYLIGWCEILRKVDAT